MDVSAATWNTLSKLLDEALDLDPGTRAAWIDGLHKTQPELAPVLRKLLAAHASSETSDLLQQLPELDAAGGTPTHVDGLGSGSLVGPYRLKREIASGGMADVWLAERADGAFERDVALKLPHLSRLRRDLAARFAHERDILARLEHPHIARFYDAGVSDDGLPYLAMEYVNGQPINRWCDERKLDTRVRLQLFAQVLDAVQFAHASLVIHRDLKPSNILVTQDGQVRLLDFGIAKLLADGEMAPATQLTQFTGRVLTPDYASPEQIRGESLTTATDTYSLGVVLYELIAGQQPYRLKLQSAAQLEEAIVAVDPARPSSAISGEAAEARATNKKRLSRALRGDLDTIVLKTLAKEPAQRYATIAELADDLRRYLAGQTVHARPTSWGYRAQKFVSRNRVAVGSTAAIGIALIVATAVSLWQARVAREQAARAEEVKQFVLSFFQAAEADRGASRQTTAVDLLRGARTRLDTAQISNDATRVELLTTIGWALFQLGDTQLSAPILEEAAQLAAAKLNDQHIIAGQTHVRFGRVLDDLGQRKLAEEQYNAAEHHGLSGGDMVTLADALRFKAGLRSTEGQVDEAIELLRQAVSAAEQQKPPIDQMELIQCYIDLAATLQRARRKGALEPAQRAYTLAREFHGDRPTEQLLFVRTIYATVLGDEGDPAVAQAEMQLVLEERARLFPGSFGHSLARRRLAELSLKLGDPDSAIEGYREVLQLEAARSGHGATSSVATALLALGNALANARRYAQAETEWRKADATFSEIQGADSEFARVARSGVGFALAKLGKLDDADSIFAPMLERTFADGRTQAIFDGRLGLLRSAQGRHAEADALARSALRFFANAPSPWAHALALADLGEVLLTSGRFEESLEPLQEAGTVLLKSQRSGSPDLADIALNLTRANLALGRPAQAKVAADEAVAFWTRFDPSQRDTGVALLWQAQALAASGEPEDATVAVGRAAGILASSSLPADSALLQQTQRAIQLSVTARN